MDCSTPDRTAYSWCQYPFPLNAFVKEAKGGKHKDGLGIGG